MELTAPELAAQGNAMVAFLQQKLSEALGEITRLNGLVAILDYKLGVANVDAGSPETSA